MVDNETEVQSLGAHLDEFFRLCVSHRESVGITDRFTKARLQVKSKYDPETCAKIAKKKEPNIFIPLTALKQRAQIAWVKDTIQNAREQLWELESGAIPELSEASQLEVVRQLAKELQMALDEGLEFDAFDAAAKKIIVAEVTLLRKESDKHIAPMTDLIRKQLYEGGFNKAFDRGLVDLYTTVGIIKAPVNEVEQRLVWGKSSSRPTVKEEEVLKIKHVDPLLLYPAPNVGDNLSKGTGVFECTGWTRDDLVHAMDVDGYDKDEIKALLRNHPSGYRMTIGDKREADALNNKDGQSDELQRVAAGLYEGFEYHGLIDNNRLNDAGLDYTGDEEFGQSEYVTMVCDGHLIYKAPNEDPSKHRPYLVCPFYPQGGSWVGEEFSTEMIDPHQRIVNAVGRNMILNMAYASGPIGEADTDRLPGGVLPGAMEPRKMYQAETGSHGERAYRFTELNSHSAEFLSILQYFFQQTDDFTIPSYVYGAPGSAGGAGLGVLTMMFNNASKSVQAVLDNIGSYWVEPLVQRLYEHNMLYSDRPEIKGPVNVVVKGLSGLLQKEFRRSMLMQGLNLVAPFMNQLPEHIKEEHVTRLLRETLDTMGIPPDMATEDPDKVARLVETAEDLQLAGAQPGTPQPQLDGRSIAEPGPVRR